MSKKSYQNLIYYITKLASFYIPLSVSETENLNGIHSGFSKYFYEKRGARRELLWIFEGRLSAEQTCSSGCIRPINLSRAGPLWSALGTGPPGGHSSRTAQHPVRPSVDASRRPTVSFESSMGVIGAFR